jgi:hypothetical protein
MAKLKKEQSEIKYVDQIGVNQGAGFSVAARSQIQAANHFNNLVSHFADFGLKELKDLGKKMGEDAAENAKFTEVEKDYKHPITGEIEKQMVPDKIPDAGVGQPTWFEPTESMQNAYDKEIYNKYKLEVESSIRGIILDERAKAIESKSNPSEFNQIIQARIDPLLDNLEPKFSTLMETYTETQRQTHWYQVQDAFVRHNEKVGNAAYTAQVMQQQIEIEAMYINGVDIKEIETKEKELTDFITNAKAAERVSALANGDRVISAMNDSKAGNKIMQSIIPDNMKDLAISKKLVVLENLKKYEMLLQGGVKKITLSTGESITAPDLLKKFNNNQTAINAMRIRVSQIVQDYNINIGDETKINTMLSYVQQNIQNAPTGVAAYFGNMSTANITELLQEPQVMELLMSEYNKLAGVTQITDYVDAYQDDGFVKYVLRTTKHLPTAMKNGIENTFTEMNQVGLNRLYDSSLLRMLTNFQQTHINPDGTTSSQTIDMLKSVGFNDEVIGKIRTMESLLSMMSMSKARQFTIDWYEKLDKSKVGNIRELLDENSKVTLTKVNERINAQIEENLKRMKGVWGFRKEVIFSERLADLVRIQVHKNIIDGGGLIKDVDAVDPYVSSALALVMNHKTNFGIDYHTYTPFKNPDDEDFEDAARWVLMPASRFYSLPNAKGELSVEWMNDEIMTLVKSSMEHQEGFSYTFGKDIFLQPLDSFSTPPRYNLIYLNRTSGEATMLQDDNGFHIVYDPNITFQKNSDLIVQTEEFKINMDNAKQSRTHYIEDNTVTDSGITKKEERMLENYKEKLGMTEITSAESKLTSFKSEMKEVDSIYDEKSFSTYMKTVENDKLISGNVKEFRHKSREDSSRKRGLDTIGFGHLLTEDEDKNNKVYGYDLSKITKENVLEISNDILRQDLEKAEKILITTHGNKFINLDNRRKQMLIDMQFNVKKFKNPDVFPEFKKALFAGDEAGMEREYKRSFKVKGKFITLARNKFFKEYFLDK